MEQNSANDMIMRTLTITGNIFIFDNSVNVYENVANFQLNTLIEILLSFRDRKIFPLALINYITLSGGGFVREPCAKVKNLAMEELIQAVFTVDSTQDFYRANLSKSC